MFNDIPGILKRVHENEEKWKHIYFIIKLSKHLKFNINKETEGNYL